MSEVEECLKKNCGNIIKKTNTLAKKLRKQYKKGSKTWKKTYDETMIMNKQRSKCSLDNCGNLVSRPMILKLWKDDLKKDTPKEQERKLKNFIESMEAEERFANASPSERRRNIKALAMIIKSTLKNRKTNRITEKIRITERIRKPEKNKKKD